MKQIIVLERAEGTPISYRVAFWLAIPSGRQDFYARPGAKSEWRDATEEENDAIATGQVLEVIDSCTMTEGASEGDVALDLQARWQAKQDELTNSLIMYRYGTYWDGTDWTVVSA